MEQDHQIALVPLLDKLYNMTYASAKELLREIDSIEKETDLRLFWRLVCILYDDEQDKIQEDFDKWVHEAIHDCIPKKCDPFLRAIFLNDKPEMVKLAMKFSPPLPLVFDSPSKSIKYSQSVPPFFEKEEFKFGKKTIPGSAVWALIVGDINGVLSLKLPWVLLFTLHYWNSGDEISSSLLTAFSSFCNFLNTKSKNNTDDPKFLLMKYYTKEIESGAVDKYLSDISSLLPPLDMLFFLRIFQVLSHDVSDNAISLALNVAKYQLIKMNCLKEAVNILSNDSKDHSQDIFSLAEYVASPEKQLTEIERHIVKNCADTLDRKNMYFFKGSKTQILQEVFGNSKSLDYAARATDFFLEAAGIPQTKKDSTCSNNGNSSQNSGNSNSDSVSSSPIKNSREKSNKNSNSNENSNENSNSSKNSNSNENSNSRENSNENSNSRENSNENSNSSKNSNSNENSNENTNTSLSDDDDFQENDEIVPEYLQYANYQAFKVYLVKSTMKGEGLERLFEWSGKFAQHHEIADMSDETQIAYKIFEAIKMANKGEIVDQLETIADEIKKNTKLNVRFRYIVASKFLNQPNGFALFSEVEMTKKEKLLEIYETAFQ